MYRNRDTDWGGIFGMLFGVAVIVAFVALLIWAINQPTCYGIEPDGEVETLWPCPAPHHDGDKFNIQEDEFDDREVE